MRRSAVVTLVALGTAVVMLGGCSSTTAGPPSVTSATAPAPASSGTAAATGGSVTAGTSAPPGTAVSASMRTRRYCEVLLVQVVDGDATADVYNSYPLNECPDEQWTQLDAAAIAGAEGVTIAVLNGPRFWLMDAVEKEGGVAGLEKKDFGGIEMYRQASVAVGPLAEASVPYTTHEVDRSTVFVFDAGESVYELTGPDGTSYVMQTWSQQKDPTLVEADLTDLGSRLVLPAGWTYASRTLDEELRLVTTAEPARVLQDDLGNSYTEVRI